MDVPKNRGKPPKMDGENKGFQTLWTNGWFGGGNLHPNPPLFFGRPPILHHLHAPSFAPGYQNAATNTATASTVEDSREPRGPTEPIHSKGNSNLHSHQVGLTGSSQEWGTLRHSIILQALKLDLETSRYAKQVTWCFVSAILPMQYLSNLLPPWP